MSDNPLILDQDQAARALGFKRAGDALKELRRQGITPIDGAKGKWIVTLFQLSRFKLEDSEDRIRF